MSEQPNREVRLAVVLYGGVSLAIYMNGISQELLRMVRGSSGLASDTLDSVEKIYCELSLTMPDNQGQRTRFLIDIISGTSAGGINGVALAKALVNGCRNLDVLRKAWTEDANIGFLLNDRNPRHLMGRRAESLLDGGHMYDVLLDTIRAMQKEKNATALTPVMDLFVTATDLEGRVVPILLTGTTLDERVHKTVFHFAYDEAAPEETDFTPDDDAMLAFAARCTSSFPVAFPPMRFDDLPTREKGGRDRYARFFPRNLEFEDRQYADGGYLDNRPFSHAIDLLSVRPTSLPGERKLLFVDPFPEAPADPQKDYVPRSFDFIQNAKLGATTLPRREVIRDDLHAINRMNARLDRLGALHKRWNADKEELKKRNLDRDRPPKKDDVDDCDLADLVSRGYGRTYPLYHHLRVYEATDTLTELSAHLAGFPAQSDEIAYMRQILRAWREAHFSPYHEKGKETETAFLSRYDLDFRLRRLVDLRAAVDEKMSGDLADQLPEVRHMIEEELAALRHLGAPATTMVENLLTAKEIGQLTTAVGEHFRRTMAKTSFEARYEAARVVYKTRPVRPLVDKAMSALGAIMQKRFKSGSERIRAKLIKPELIGLLTRYNEFHWHDAMTFPFLEGTGAAEHSEIQVFRISPADSGLNDSPSKLAGVAFGAFGGFLSRDWREHDILWGRLDGAERIVTALLPDDTHKDLRISFVNRLQEAILLDEYEGECGSDRRLALLKAKLADRNVGDEALEDLAAGALGVTNPLPLGLQRFKDHYKKTKPIGPSVREMTHWASRSAGILARMIDDLPSTGALAMFSDRVSGRLRMGGSFTGRIVRFATPGSLQRIQAEHLLFLAMLAGIIIVALAALMMIIGFGTPSSSIPARVGFIILAVAAAIWAGLYTVGRMLSGQLAFSLFVRRFLYLAGAVMILIGIWTSWNTLCDLWASWR
ncbi:MAG: DUF3376 domain-containing protein [Cereibacter sphaeroides]|uniref:DUF3376 domain-containing protein n=1 Tax=Cereibacter sphaeroides TaxID=1063 RepID=A0A2W5UBX4_CERSP|nr:MAG: DUF3376 domain-containing protein [Cereibacter sphaeroides]